MVIDAGRKGEKSGIDQLPLSARLVLNYMTFEHLINGRQYLTFRDIVEGTGLGVRTVRSAIGLLKKRGLIEVYIDVHERRKYLYRLKFQNVSERLDVSPGVYLIDIGIGTLQSMTFRMYRTLRASNIIVHTESVPHSYLELTRCSCIIERIDKYTPESLANLAKTVVFNGGVMSLAFDSLLDSDHIAPYIAALGPGEIPISRIFGVSPIQIAIELLENGHEDELTYCRDNIVLRVITTRKRPVLRNAIKVLAIVKEGQSFRVIHDANTIDEDGLKAFIIYAKR